MNEIKNTISLSWLIINTRDYKKEYDWFWDKRHSCCYGIMKTERADDICKDLARIYMRVSNNEKYYSECVLLPELRMLTIEEAASYLRGWCEANSIVYKEDLEQYKAVERFYWGYDEDL